MKSLLKTIRLMVPFIMILGMIAMAALPGNAALQKAHPRLVQMAAEDPQQIVAVIVQKLGEGSGLEVKIAKLGGEITKDLHIINAFAAKMSAGAVLELAREPEVRWVSLDGLVQTSQTGTTDLLTVEPTLSLAYASIPTVRDEFNTTSFSNNDGTSKWATDWLETGDSSGPSSGNITVEVDYCPDPSSRCIEFDADAGRGATIEREVDLSGTSAATLTFDYRIDGGRTIYALDVSSDGGASWISLFKVASYGIGQGNIDLSPYSAAKTRVRFRLVETDYKGHLYIDNVQVAYQFAWDNTYLATTGASTLHAEGITGQGVTVAVIDSGVDTNHPDLAKSLVATPFGAGDLNGHGTHVSGIVAGDGTASAGYYKGIAPDVNLININVNEADGYSYVSTVVEGLQWVYDNRETYNIRAVNLSLNSTVEVSYHESPLNAAGEILWFNGVVVVVSAGNKGPLGGANTAKTGPANDPFFITVGAGDEHDTADRLDDTIAPFSVFGTTQDGFEKPDIIAPGYYILAPLSADSLWHVEVPDRIAADDYIKISGTSMAAPMVTGAVALILQNEPGLTPDQVKYRLLNTGSTLSNDEGNSYAYLDIYAAVHSPTTESANTGLTPSKLLFTGDESVAWNSVAWNSVAWNSVAWNSVAWNSVAWNSVAWNSMIDFDAGIYWGPRGRNK